MIGLSRLMLKRPDFQLTCCYLNTWHDKLSTEIFGLLRKLHRQCFLQFVHCNRQLYKDDKCPNSSQAGKKSLGPEYYMIKVFSYQDLSMFTNGFSNENFVDNFLFGRVFRGKIEERQVTVKIWEFPANGVYMVIPGQNGGRLRDEVVLLQHPKLISHPNLVKLIGYCHEGEKLGVVYDLKSPDTVYNLVLKDSFTWLLRIKVAFGFACLLKFLHAYNPHRPYLVCNICASHIMLDQDYNPKLLDFGMFTGGILPDRRVEQFKRQYGCCYDLISFDGSGGGWSKSFDVFNYGLLLISLICKRIYTEEDRQCDTYIADVYQWATWEYEAKMSMTGSAQSKPSLVHQSLEADPGFCSCDGLELTKLALQCVQFSKQPTMEEVVKRLLNLRVVRLHADELGIKQMLGWDSNF